MGLYAPFLFLRVCHCEPVGRGNPEVSALNSGLLHFIRNDEVEAVIASRLLAASEAWRVAIQNAAVETSTSWIASLRLRLRSQ